MVLEKLQNLVLVFKLATLISLLEDKYVNKNSIVDCEGVQNIFMA